MAIISWLDGESCISTNSFEKGLQDIRLIYHQLAF